MDSWVEKNRLRWNLFSFGRVKPSTIFLANGGHVHKLIFVNAL